MTTKLNKPKAVVKTSTHWPQSRRGNCDTVTSASPDAHDGAIDQTVLDMLRRLEGHRDVSFDQQVATFTRRIKKSLQLLNHAPDDMGNAEKAAREISNDALMLGAVRVMKLSYELQNMARLGQNREVRELAERLEAEFDKAAAALEVHTAADRPQ